jgi:hypothetical protein
MGIGKIEELCSYTGASDEDDDSSLVLAVCSTSLSNHTGSILVLLAQLVTNNDCFIVNISNVRGVVRNKLDTHLTIARANVIR